MQKLIFTELKGNFRNKLAIQYLKTSGNAASLAAPWRPVGEIVCVMMPTSQ
ncbi:hypothetical protein AAH446_08120 [Erwinia sp. P6884]|uniref:hypothetical protein n=1 Tax=Erwinia sp. P6884 TaxID=3141450 RepID=UPI003191CD73